MDYDWIYEGLEGEDFGDDIFVDTTTLPPESSNAPYAVPQSSDAPHTALESSNAPHTAPYNIEWIKPVGVDDTEWTEPALEDDLVSMDGSDDEQVPKQP